MLRRILTALLVIALLLVTVFVVLVIRAKPMLDHPFFANDDFLVIAHRGGAGLRPENTLAAFQHAVELGVDVLEMDIHSTSDGVLVTIHDATVDRTTNGTGQVQDLTFTALQELDAGYSWTVDDAQADHPYRGQGITIPALEEIFQTFPSIPMNIEIKQLEPSIAQPFCDLIRQYEMVDQVLVASFHPQALNEFREACPEVATSGVENDIRVFYILNTIKLGAVYQPVAHAFQVPEYSGGLHVVTPGFVSGAHRHNVEVHVWTVNEVEQMERMIEAGVDGIITNYPDRLLELVGR